MSNTEKSIVKLKKKEEETKEDLKLLSPKVDVVFQVLFGRVGSERITKSFLEAILKTSIDNIDLSKNPILERDKLKDKMGILDVLAKIDGKENCNVEMQMTEKNNMMERILYYWSKLYYRQIEKGDDYDTLQRTIVVLIANYEMPELKGLSYYTKWAITNISEGKRIILTNKLEIDIIELPKIQKEKIDKNKELLDWLYFIEDPESERVKDIMKENVAVKEAYEKLQKISADEEMRILADLRQKAIMDEKAIYARGIDVGEEKGLKRGREEGMKEGIEQGIKQEKIDTAKKLLELNIKIEDIIKATGLSKEEIEKLK